MSSRKRVQLRPLGGEIINVTASSDFPDSGPCAVESSQPSGTPSTTFPANVTAKSYNANRID